MKLSAAKEKKAGDRKHSEREKGTNRNLQVVRARRHLDLH
jgi:hypothetical protein